MKTYFTASELSRELGIPTSRITSAVEAGHLKPDGRAGGNKNSPLIFESVRIREIEAVLDAEISPRPPVTRLISPLK